jgi:hypothetical protein
MLAASPRRAMATARATCGRSISQTGPSPATSNLHPAAAQGVPAEPGGAGRRHPFGHDHRRHRCLYRGNGKFQWDGVRCWPFKHASFHGRDHAALADRTPIGRCPQRPIGVTAFWDATAMAPSHPDCVQDDSYDRIATRRHSPRFCRASGWVGVCAGGWTSSGASGVMPPREVVRALA